MVNRTDSKAHHKPTLTARPSCLCAMLNYTHVPRPQKLVAGFRPRWLLNDYQSTGEAICHCPEEGSNKSGRKLVYEMYYFCTCDAVEVVTVVT